MDKPKDIDIYCMKVAVQAAAIYSTDPSNQNGAVLWDPVKEKIVCKSANFFPNGVKETVERWIRPDKYFYVEHAERNVIYKAASLGIKTEGLVLYAPWISCSDCARGIVQSGIKEAVGAIFDLPLKRLSREGQRGGEQWDKTNMIGEQIMTEGGVIIRRYKFPKFGFKIRIDEELFEV